MMRIWKILLIFMAGCLAFGLVYALNLAALPTPQLSSQAEKPKTAEQQPPALVQSRLWNLQDADIRAVINEISRETGKNFIVDPRVTGTVSVVSTTPLTSAEVYQVFLSILQVYGYAAVPSGKVIKIVPEVNAKILASPVVGQAFPGEGDQLVVRVVKLDYVSAAELVPILRPLISEWGEIAAYSPANTLIISGRAGNVARVANIVSRVDTPESNDVEMIPLHNATAADVVKIIARLQATQDPSGPPKISLAADDRSNSILLSGSKNTRLRMRVLITELDGAKSIAGGNTEVIYLQYLKAKSLAPILSNIAQGVLAKATTADQTSSSAAKDQPTPIAPASDDSGNPQISIQAEPNTNAIIITAPPALMRTLKTVIARVDVRPAQVLVEAAIVEVSESTLKQLGIQWGTTESGAAADGTSLGIPSFATAGGLGVGIITHGSISSVINFLATDTASNILSTPSIMVMDNQQAKIFVGQDVPFTTGSYAAPGTDTNTSTGVQAFNTVSREKVGLTLDVTPQINLGDAVRLAIKQENATLGAALTSTSDPITNNASIDTTVLVNSGDILVLGGLISSDIEEETSKVPILGDIPGLGLLFRSKDNTVTKKNLMVFIRPVIMRNPEQGIDITGDKYDLIRNKQLLARYDEGASTAVKQAPLLPAWESRPPIPMPFTQ